ncbi:MAG TPA: RNA methyltransferase [Gemmatimonadales bacterium]
MTAIRDLHRRKGRERRGLALAEGIRLVEEMLAANAACKGAVASPALGATARGAQLHRELLQRGIEVDEVTDAELADLADTEHPQGIVAVFQVPIWPIDSLAPRPGRPLVVLDGVQDPGNVGTIARTARAFGAAGIVALPGTADLTNPKTVRGAMGALFTLPHLHAAEADLVDRIATWGADLWAMTLTGQALSSESAGRPIALVFGNEGAGIQPSILALATRQVTIPVQPGTESLNVATAAGIALYLVSR